VTVLPITIALAQVPALKPRQCIHIKSGATTADHGQEPTVAFLG
jgi:hypothetical protein